MEKHLRERVELHVLEVEVDFFLRDFDVESLTDIFHHPSSIHLIDERDWIHQFEKFASPESPDETDSRRNRYPLSQFPQVCI